MLPIKGGASHDPLWIDLLALFVKATVGCIVTTIFRKKLGESLFHFLLRLLIVRLRAF
jgi:hypothetical protein